MPQVVGFYHHETWIAFPVLSFNLPLVQPHPLQAFRMVTTGREYSDSFVFSPYSPSLSLSLSPPTPTTLINNKKCHKASANSVLGKSTIKSHYKWKVYSNI